MDDVTVNCTTPRCATDTMELNDAATPRLAHSVAKPTRSWPVSRNCAAAIAAVTTTGRVAEVVLARVSTAEPTAFDTTVAVSVLVHVRSDIVSRKGTCGSPSSRSARYRRDRRLRACPASDCSKPA